jgi:hypothetical protein
MSVPAGARNILDMTACPIHQSRMQDGIEMVESAGRLTGARIIELEQRVSRRGQFAIEVLNAGDEPYNFGSENVRAELLDGTPVPIIHFEQLAREERNRQTWAAILTGLAAAGNSLSAANAGHTYGYVGRTPFSIRSNTSNFLATSLAAQQNQAQFAALQANNQAAMAALRSNLRTSTVDPGSSFGGMINFEIPSDRRRITDQLPIRFTVQVGPTEHQFVGFVRPERPRAPRRGSTTPLINRDEVLQTWCQSGLVEPEPVQQPASDSNSDFEKPGVVPTEVEISDDSDIVSPVEAAPLQEAPVGKPKG